jgi:hypothetical protein
MDRAGETHPLKAAAGADCVAAPVAVAPCAFTSSAPAGNLAKFPQVTKNPPSVGCHESWRNDLITPVSFIIGAIRIPALQGV